MQQNVGLIDKVIPYIICLLAVIAGIYYQSWWGLVGFIPLFTATISWCPMYAPFKISTRKKE